ncbi:MAG: hypothetical protein KatS3mg057_2129 [Herpetosiphonaceae bacterium]|nr:MAG: hypothetical protein KatS3mg057_2129 [Herpetosiphonaceae bacterium]
MRLRITYPHPRSTFIVLWFVVAALIFGGCGSTPAAPTAAPTALTVQLAYAHNIEYAGFYMAADKGYYSAENLNVTVEPLPPGQPKSVIEDLVASGKAQFGITSADTLLRARANGKPFVAIATIYQRNPTVLISMAEKNIVRPEDLTGRNIMMSRKGTAIISLKALLKQAGIAESMVNIVEPTDFTSTPLIEGKVDVQAGFINNQPIGLEQAGHKINMILFSDYGIEIYANVIFTTEEMIAKHPDAVERFLRATLRGYQDVVDHPEEAAKLTVAWNPERNLEYETESLMRGLPLIKPAGSKPGMMNPDHWALVHSFLVDQGILSEPLNLDDAYTLQFLQKIYADTTSG